MRTSGVVGTRLQPWGSKPTWLALQRLRGPRRAVKKFLSDTDRSARYHAARVEAGVGRLTSGKARKSVVDLASQLRNAGVQVRGSVTRSLTGTCALPRTLNACLAMSLSHAMPAHCSSSCCCI